MRTKLRDLRLRIWVAFSALRGHSVMYRMYVQPWAGPQPGDGPAEEGWTLLVPLNAGMLMCDSTLVKPVLPCRKMPKVSGKQEAWPYVWLPEVIDEEG